MPTVQTEPVRVRVALPEEFRLALPSLVEPSKKVTAPVGAPPLPLTLAVRVSEPPALDGFAPDVSVVEEVARVTFSESAVPAGERMRAGSKRGNGECGGAVRDDCDAEGVCSVVEGDSA